MWATRGLAFNIRGRGTGMWNAAFAIGQFLSNVGSLNRIIAPVTLQANPHAIADRTKAHAKKGESLLDTQFLMQTYVARTTPLAPPEARR